jgi:hypothetical protein
MGTLFNPAVRLKKRPLNNRDINIMPNVYEVSEKMHKMRARLYPNYLPGGEGTYIARSANEGAVKIEDICASMKNRAGYAGSYEECVQTVKHFFKEMEYQLGDGFSVNTGFFSIRPNIGGVFESDKEFADPEKHPITFRFQALKPMLKMRDGIEVIIEGYADSKGWISEFMDVEENSVNLIFMPGNMFSISGNKIKLAGDDPSVGVYFVPVDDPSKAVKVARIGENTPIRVTGIAPDTGYIHNKIEIRTQYLGSTSNFLKSPRIIVSSFTLEQV